MTETELSKELLAFIRECPSMFHTAAAIADRLERAGYRRLEEKDRWQICPGGKYYVLRNGSSVAAFQIGNETDDYTFHIAASHGDYPTFKIKEKADLDVRSRYIVLNTEGYGGMICSSWFDRPLSAAGRVLVKNGDCLEQRLVNIDRDLVMIPSVAIHMNRSVNDGYAYNRQIDLLPLFGGQNTEKGTFDRMIAEAAGTVPENIYGKDLYLYNRMEGTVWGANGEFISAPHLDDTQCAFAALKGFLQAEAGGAVGVFACFDNEEVGSGTKQGAGSTFLYDVLRRINSGLGKTEEDYFRAVAGSFMISADNAHAVHPNHPEKTDAKNCVYMNEGIVIKSHAGQKYTTDAVSAAVFRQLCEKAGAPVQYFANRSDQAGGSTLGNISSGQVSINTVDVGLAQLSMHSAYETAGMKDTEYMVKAMTAFFSCSLRAEESRYSWE